MRNESITFGSKKLTGEHEKAVKATHGLQAKLLYISFVVSYFYSILSPFRVAAAQWKKICPERLNFKIKNSRQLFIIIFKPKMLVSRPDILFHLF